MVYIKVIYFLLISFSAQALVPLDGIIYGNVRDSQEYDKFQGLLSYDYTKDQTNSQELAKLLAFKALQSEAMNLNGFCEEVPKIKYTNSWKKSTAIRSYVGTLQYIGLDIATRAIAEYAKKIEMNETDYNYLANNLVDHYCSQNISVYSQKTLKDNLLNFKNSKTGFSLPSVENSPYFPKRFKERHNTLKALKKEFNLTVMNFRALCSWDGNTSDYRLLVPYIKSPVLMSYIINKMLGRGFDYNPENLEILVKKEEPVQVGCEDLMCRKRDPLVFNKLYPKMIGSTRLEDDLKAIYCDEFTEAKYNKNSSQSSILKWIKEMGKFEHRLQVSQLISLITQVPDPAIFTDNMQDIRALLKENIQERWDRWADKRVRKVQISQLYEEPLEIELLSQVNTSEIRRGEFNMHFRLSLSEIDKVLNDVDKIDSYFNLEFEASYLAFLRERISFHYNRGDLTTVDQIEKGLVAKIMTKIKDKEKYFKIKLSRKDFAEILAKELVAQVNAYLGNKLQRVSKKMVKIPIRFTYGIFALQYIHQKFIYEQKSKQLLTFK